MTLWDGVLLVAGGAFAGVVNAVAGGGSILTVPLLVISGVPGNFANGSNRLGILTSTAASSASFHRLGVGGLAHAAPILVPVLLGSLVGSMAISQLTDDTFETVFGLLMLPLVLLSLRQPRAVSDGVVWSPTVTFAVFLAIGVYGGAIQAGVGLVLLAALSRAGFDLVTANHIKALITLGERRLDPRLDPRRRLDRRWLDRRPGRLPRRRTPDPRRHGGSRVRPLGKAARRASLRELNRPAPCYDRSSR
jgi:uncharacterized membrane protein YfcA